jgi:acyl homoserine lactone synthase
MFIAVQAPQYQKYRAVLDQMFRLRKRVFCDQLRWDVKTEGEYECDSYDALNPVYMIWCSPDARTLYGSMRLMPTSGPTLLYDVFRETFPHGATLSAPGIWEATRTCIDTDNIRRDHARMDAARGFGLLCLATAECAVAHNIQTLICNYEPPMKRIYDRAGATIQELGRAGGFGRRPVCCGAFRMDNQTIAEMRSALKVDLPLYQSWRSAGRAHQNADLAA